MSLSLVHRLLQAGDQALGGIELALSSARRIIGPFSRSPSNTSSPERAPSPTRSPAEDVMFMPYRLPRWIMPNAPRLSLLQLSSAPRRSWSRSLPSPELDSAVSPCERGENSGLVRGICAAKAKRCDGLCLPSFEATARFICCLTSGVLGRNQGVALRLRILERRPERQGVESVCSSIHGELAGEEIYMTSPIFTLACSSSRESSSRVRLKLSSMFLTFWWWLWEKRSGSRRLRRFPSAPRRTPCRAAVLLPRTVGAGPRAA